MREVANPAYLLACRRMPRPPLARTLVLANYLDAAMLREAA